MSLPSRVPNWVSGSTIRAVKSGMIEMLCQGKQDKLVVRKAVGSDDISGDFSDYSEASTVELDGRSVTMKGESGKIMVITWQDDAYTYAVLTTGGMDRDNLSALVSDVK